MVRCLSASREQRVRQLSREEMDDRKPSQFLRYLNGLSPDVLDDICTIWASLLRQHVQAILFGQAERSLDSASQHTERFCEFLPQPTSAKISPSVPDNTYVHQERTEVLSRQDAFLRAAQTRRRSHLKNDRLSTPDNSPTGHKICYHRRFGDGDQNCTLPCPR